MLTTQSGVEFKMRGYLHVRPLYVFMAWRGSAALRFTVRLTRMGTFSCFRPAAGIWTTWFKSSSLKVSEDCVFLGYYAASCSGNSLCVCVCVCVCVYVHRSISQIKHQLDATLCRFFFFCRVTLHVSGVKRPSSGVLKNWHGGPWYRCYSCR